MARWQLPPTKLDKRVARAVARHASPVVERPSRLLTWAADEHLLLAISAALWLASRDGDDRARRQADHLVLSVAATAILPHLLKRVIDQERPDRQMIHGTTLGQALRRLSFRPRHACRRGRLRRLLGISKVGAGRLGTGRPGCCNAHRPAGALDDGCRCRLGHGDSGRALSSASVRTHACDG